MNRCKKIKLSSSFRDPSGFLFTEKGSLLRQVNNCYRENYDLLMSSGLYSKLVEKGLLIPHEEIDTYTNGAYKILRPEKIGFISYPYEWSFSQLKDAALTTLELQKTALDHGMSLKDASAYNIQFFKGRPLLIDTLSFEAYNEGRPWVAYRQFCQHFLAPLALMSGADLRLNQLLRIYIDGVPLDLASCLLPLRTRMNIGLLMHIHLHAKSQGKYSDSGIESGFRERKVSKLALRGIIDSLEKTIMSMYLREKKTEWGDYYSDTNYSDESFRNKKKLITSFIAEVKPSQVWDLGANTGVFSRISASSGIDTISFDIDPLAVEKNYLEIRKENNSHVQPLLIDLSNPSPGAGWDNCERDSLKARGPVDLVMFLALIHHLAISNNVPLSLIASFLSGICRWLIIEFVPKTDSQVLRLLRSREDIFDSYDERNFESDFREFFTIKKKECIKGSERILYLMKKI